MDKLSLSNLRKMAETLKKVHQLCKGYDSTEEDPQKERTKDDDATEAAASPVIEPGAKTWVSWFIYKSIERPSMSLSYMLRPQML